MAWLDTYQKWLTEAESLQNAQQVVNHLYGGTDWSKEAICALLGNMRHESSINPNMYEFGYDWSADRGFGLVQWTPRSKYWDWAEGLGKAPREGDSQLDRIDYEVEHNIQWIPVSSYGGMTFAQFRSNSGDWSIDYLTEAFTWSYERPASGPGNESLPGRKAFANKASSQLSWDGSPNPDPDPDPDPDPGDDEDNDSGIQYIDLYGDLLYIKMVAREGLITALPLGTNRWIVSGATGDDSGDNPGDGGTTEPGVFISPAPGRITSEYGPRDFGGQNFHAGIDIANDTGTPIHAARSGTILKTGTGIAVGRSGLAVSQDVDEDDTGFYYGHLSKILVEPGQHVNAGEVIALMGATGNVTGPHLHFETWTTAGNEGTHHNPREVFTQFGVTPGSEPVIP